MNARDMLGNTLDLAKMITDAYLGDLSDADLLRRPAPGCNHIAWQLGHLIDSGCGMLAGLGKSGPALPAGFAAAHGKDTAGSDDPTKFLSKAEYLRLLDGLRDAARSAIASYSEADLDKPGPESMREYAPTIGTVLNLIGTHEIMHCGQWVPVRRALGKPVVM